jgi:hypothetical protein
LDDFSDEDDDEEVIPPVSILMWERLARILSHMGQKVRLGLDVRGDLWAVGEVQALARVIHGHPTIIRYDGGSRLSYESLDALYSALATLPALESIFISNLGLHLHTRPENESAMAYPESLTELLRVPSLRFVRFYCVSFTRALSQSISNALMEGTAVIKLEFKKCSVSVGESARILANAFSRKTSVASIKVCSSCDEVLNSALVAALPSNSTLQELFPFRFIRLTISLQT